jgi:putative PEP-CTERM system histidine kinase
MGANAAELATYGYAISTILFAALAVALAASAPMRQGLGATGALFVAAIVASAGWAGFSLWDLYSRLAAPGWAAAAADLLRYALWFAFLIAVLRPGGGSGRPGAWLKPAAIVLVAAGLLLLALAAVAGLAMPMRSRPALAVGLAMPVLGLVLVEQLFRNLPEDSRWSAKPMCLGLACVFVFDVFVYTEAVLFGVFDADAQAVRGAVHALGVPLLYVGIGRRGDWVAKMQVSRRLAFYSASLLLAGGYLLFMSAVGYYVRFFGGDWGRALQLSLAFATVLGLTLFAFSGSLRARLRVFLNKHFFRYRYDYREEWLRFTAMLSTKIAPQEVGQLVVRGLANMVECPAGSLWTKAPGEAAFRQSARWNLPVVDDREPDDSAFARFLREPGWVIDVDEFRDSPRRYGDLALPLWLLGSPNLWLVVPLVVGDELLGFAVLARPRTPIKVDWEVRDLLKTASRQAAGFLAQMQATEALLEARKFDAFNRMSAFVVHDLKNIVTQLSLMLKNAERLHDNAEFQQDMLLTVESSLEKMRRLMLQLREGATPPGGAHGVELAPIVGRLQAMAKSRGRSIEAEVADRLATRGHEERLERVLGHFVHNALDATPPDGRVWVKAGRHSGQVKVEIGDTGAGMTEEFVQTRLFRPFNTTKHNGMGIGTYEGFQYIRELGGTIAVDSAPGRGTVVTVLMPVFEAQRASDLQMPATP